MRAQRLTTTIGMLCAGLTLLSCKDSLFNNPVDATTTATTDATVVGLYSGNDTVTGLLITAIVDSNGETVFIRGDGVQFAGSLQVSGNTVSGTFDGYTNFNATFNDGSNTGSGTFNGTIAANESIASTFNFTTGGGTSSSATWPLTLASLSTIGSSPNAVSGNYTDTNTKVIVSITAGGDMNSQDASSGCVMIGTISTDDAAHDVYQVAYSYAGCSGSRALLNGIKFSGLGFLNNKSSPTQLTLAVAGTAATSKYAIVSYLDGA